MPEVTLYTREGCHLCDEVKAELDRLKSKADFRLSIVDIDNHPELRVRFSNEVPVIFINGRKAFKYRIQPKEFLDRLERW